MARVPFDSSCGFDIAATTIRDPGALDRITTWGYRLVRHEPGVLFLHEAFYDTEGALLGLALAPTRPCGETPEQIREELAWMEEGMDEPILDHAELGASGGRYDRYGWMGENGTEAPSGPFRNN